MHRRVTYVATLAFTAAAAWFAARALADPVPREPARERDAEGYGTSRSTEDALGAPAGRVAITREELLAANLFDAPPPSVSPDAPPQEPSVARPTATGAGTPAPCTLPFRVLALVAFAPAQQHRSLATVERGADVREVRVGDHLDDAIVTRIARDRLFFHRPGEAEECYIDIREASPPARPTATAPVPPPETTVPADAPPEPDPRSRFQQAVESSIRELGDGEFEVQRSLVRTLLDNPELAMDALRVVPAQDRGAPVGFRLFGVRGGSLAEHLGLRSGDVVRAVNGLPMTSMDNVMRAYGLLRMAEQIAVEVTRRGEQRTFVYRMR